MLGGGAPPRRPDCREGPERDQSGSGREGLRLRRARRATEGGSLREPLREGALPPQVRLGEGQDSLE